MARNRWTVAVEMAINLPAGVEKTIIQVASPSNLIEAIQHASVTFRGTQGGAVPVLVKLVKQTTAGTGGVAVTPRKMRSTGITLQVTAQRGPTSGGWTTEPTQGDVLDVLDIHPQSGVLYPFTLPDGEIEIANGERLAIVGLAQDAVDCHAVIKGEE